MSMSNTIQERRQQIEKDIECLKGLLCRLRRAQEVAEKCKRLFGNVPEVADVQADIISGMENPNNGESRVVIFIKGEKEFQCSENPRYFDEMFPSEIDGIEVWVCIPRSDHHSEMRSLKREA